MTKKGLGRIGEGVVVKGVFSLTIA